AVLAVCFAGCTTTLSRDDTAEKSPGEMGNVPLSATTEVSEPGPIHEAELGLSVQHRLIKATVFPGPKDSHCVLILGGIHGSEPSSTELVERLSEHLKEQREDCAGKTVVLITHANPDGLAAGTRHNARGIDLNRNFLTPNFKASKRHGKEPLSEPETLALVGAIGQYGPSTVVSVHAPLNCIDPDGGEASTHLAHEMVAVSPLPFKDLPAHPGSMGSYVGPKLGLKMITYELDKKKAPASNPNEYLDKHLPALLLAIKKR
ncbi:MAG: DUF2817 domain-containing protein, partial [Planctomycetes bacterium]|nr:DUF2817 domain-containing protein [Planctomycetota bacterium]